MRDNVSRGYLVLRVPTERPVIYPDGKEEYGASNGSKSMVENVIENPVRRKEFAFNTVYCFNLY